MPGRTLKLANLIALAGVVLLVGIAWSNHDERDRLPKVSVFFMIWSVPDFMLDCFWVHERNFSPDPRGYFVAGITVLVGTCVLNVIGTVAAIRVESKRFDGNKFADAAYGIPYPFITVLCFTNTDCLMLLPWKYDNEETFIVEHTGFPCKSLLMISFLRLLEDVGQAIVQAIYLINTRGSDTLTVYSLVSSFATIAYLFVCKIVFYITSSGTDEEGERRSAKVYAA